MENAVLRSAARHNLNIGNNCLIGPNAHVVGWTVEQQVFIATGATVFHSAHLEARSEIRVNAVVHIRTRVLAGETVPIGWIAVGDPASCFPPDRHEDIWRILKPLNFPLTVYGFDRADADMIKITKRLSQMLASHVEDASARQ
jgi:carbonic anhydrase/acetyltransferase-like protein (isoleucine patch superfamily)